MSLINDLLRDLEDRRGGNHDKHEIFDGLSTVNDVPEPENGRRYIGPLLFLAGIFGLLFLLNMSIPATPVMTEISSATDVRKLEAKESVSTADKEVRSDSSNRNKKEKEITSAESNLDVNALGLAIDDSLSLTVADYIDRPSETEVNAVSAESVEENGKVIIEDVVFDSVDEKLKTSISLTGNSGYRVYSLADPNRIVVEIDGAEFQKGIPRLENTSLVKEVRKGVHDGYVKLVFDMKEPVSIENEQLKSAGDVYLLSFLLSKKTDGEEQPSTELAISRAQEGEVRSEQSVVNHRMEKTPRQNNGPDLAQKLYKEGAYAYKQGSMDESIEKLSNVLELEPDNNQARHLLASAYIRQKKVKQAAYVLEQGVKLSPGDASIKMLYARLLHEGGSTEKAVEVLRISKPAIEQEPEYHALLAALLQEGNRYTESAAIYRNLVSLYPDKSVWWMGLGISLERNSEHSAAITAYREALQQGALSVPLQQYVTERLKSLTGEQRT